MTSKVGKRPLRSLSAHEKMEAIRRVHDGESKASVARDIGVPESTLRGWCKNEDKILYLSRQSTPETDDSDHLQPREKKPRFDDLQPYNLSVRAASNSPEPTEPDSALNLTKDSPKAPHVPLAPQCPQVPQGGSLVPQGGSLVPQGGSLVPQGGSLVPQGSLVAPVSSVSISDRERERNRAELARLSVELGLDRPEMFSTTANMQQTTVDISALVAQQWNSALLQQVANPKKRTSSSAGLDASSSAGLEAVIPTAHAQNYNNNNVKHNKVKKHPQQPPQQQLDPSLDDSVWYWLKTQQAMLGLVQNQNQNQTIPNSVDPNSSWFWKWYKQLAYSQHFQQQQQQQQQQQPLQIPTTTTTVVPEPILYQQLTKDTEKLAENIPKSSSKTTKVRAVLDNLLLNNNNNDEPPANINNSLDDLKEEKADEMSSSPSSVLEALNHGEMFLKWLEKCSDPSVTAVQVLQLKYLLNNVRMGADRKNGAAGAENMKTKVRSRK